MRIQDLSGSASSISFLKPEDINLLAPLMKEFYEEGNIQGSFNQEYAAKSVGGLLQSGTGFCLYQGRPILGAICAFVYPDFGTGDLCCNEYFWFVTKKARGGSLGMRLFKAFEEEAKRRDVKRILVGHIMTSDERDSTMKKVYESQGYKLKEQSFLKCVQPQQQ